MINNFTHHTAINKAITANKELIITGFSSISKLTVLAMKNPENVIPDKNRKIYSNFITIGLNIGL